MINVKFFGLYRQKTDTFAYELKAERLDALLKYLETVSGIPLNELKKGVIFVNKTPIENLKGFKTPLKAGDEVAILSPASGG